MVNNLVFEQDMEKPVQMRHLPSYIFENTKEGLRLSCYVYRNGQPENLTGSISVLGLTQDTATRSATGTISSDETNLAYVDLPASFFYPGLVTIVMYNVSSNSNISTPILALSGVCVRVNGEAYVDTGNVIPSLASYTTLAGNIQTAATAIANNISMSAQVVTANSDRYKCVVTKSS